MTEVVTAAMKSFSLRNFSDNFLRSFARFRRRLPSSKDRLVPYLAVLGPGIIAANAGNDASGIATYSSAGAAYGYVLLWIFIPMTLSLFIIQEMCVRMGIVTGKGLADLIRENFGVRWTTLIMLALLIANIGVIISEFVGIAQASELFGVSRFIGVPFAAGFIWWLVVRGTQKRVEQVFLAMSLVFFCYVASALMAKPDWGEVASGLFKPHLSDDHGYLFLIVALVGTTITPFMQIFVQSSVVEKGLTKEDYKIVRADVLIGTSFSIMIAAFIVIATAATLHKSGIRELDSAATAAEALAPVVGIYAKYLFAVGLVGAAMLAMGVLPLATAYSLSEALGFEKGISHTFREAPIFLGIFTTLILIGAAVSLIPHIPQIKLLIFTQSLNGVLLPFLLIAILRLSNNRELMGEYKNSFYFNLAAITVVVVCSALSIALIVKTIIEGVF